jgi:hypothetical protein
MVVGPAVGVSREADTPSQRFPLCPRAPGATPRVPYPHDHAGVYRCCLYGGVGVTGLHPPGHCSTYG